MWFPDDAEWLLALARLITQWLSRRCARPRINRWKERTRAFTPRPIGGATKTSERMAAARSATDSRPTNPDFACRKRSVTRLFHAGVGRRNHVVSPGPRSRQVTTGSLHEYLGLTMASLPGHTFDLEIAEAFRTFSRGPPVDLQPPVPQPRVCNASGVRHPVWYPHRSRFAVRPTAATLGEW